MADPVVGNRDRCGRCRTRHGGNDHLCSVHGPVSRGCCEPICMRLGADTRATLIHGKTGQEVEDTLLLKGTVYTREGTAAPNPVTGAEAHTILVEGYRYRVEGEAP